MPLIVCELEGFGTSTTCNKKKGVRRVFAAQGSLIDWEAMLTDNTKFDPATEQILGYEYLTGGKHVELTFERKSGQFDATYTRDTGYYDTILQMILNGKDRTRTNSIKRMIACCDLSLHIYMADGTQRVLGIDYDGEAFDKPLLKFEISRHLDSAGALEGDESRDELDFNGQLEFAPLFANVPVATLRASAAPAVTTAYGPAADGEDGYGPAAGGTEVYGPVAGSVEGEAEAVTAKPKPKTTKS